MASAGTVTIEGLNECKAALKKVGASTAEPGIWLEAAKLVSEAAKQRAPKQSGRLRASIEADASARAGFVTVGAPTLRYTGAIHFGWSTRGLGSGTSKADLVTAFSGKFTRATINKASRYASNRKSKGRVRGGPIKPNPFLYTALDSRVDAITDRYDQQLNIIARAFNT